MGTSFLDPALRPPSVTRNSALGARSAGMAVFYNTHWDEGQRPAIMGRYIVPYRSEAA